MRERNEHDSEADDNISVRVLSGALGLLSGALLGFVLATLVAIGFDGDAYFPQFVFGCAALGAVLGYMHGPIGIGIAEGTSHLAVGFVLGLAVLIVDPVPEAPRWLKSLYWLGLLFGLAFIFRRWL